MALFDDTRRRCPLCRSKKVREETDKSKALYYLAGSPIYGKKMVCTDCKHEWKL